MWELTPVVGAAHVQEQEIFAADLAICKHKCRLAQLLHFRHQWCPRVVKGADEQATRHQSRCWISVKGTCWTYFDTEEESG